VAQDPQVPNAVWQANQHSAGGLNWATYVSRLQTGGSTYVPITPLRVLDSRVNVGTTGSFLANSAKSFQVTGVGTIPADAIAITGNVTIIGQQAAGYVSVTTTPTNTPTSSSINFPLGDVRANNVTAPLSSAGQLSAVYKAATGKRTHIAFDVTGYFLDGDEDAAYNTLTSPLRVLDSRVGTGLAGTFAHDTPRTLLVATGTNGIPTDAVAVTANLTVVGQTTGGFATVTPTTPTFPLGTSNINFPKGDTRANGLTAKLDSGNLVLTFHGTATSARTNLILDITGYYLAAGDGLLFFPLNPSRILDSRFGTGLAGKFTNDVARALDTDGHLGVPAGASAVAGNLTVTGQNAGGYVAITPDPPALPLATSTINFPNGDTRANGVTVGLDGTGDMNLTYHGGAGKSTHLILDLTGYFE
jgi:hypothetical protein